YIFFFSSRRRHTRSKRDWSSDVCSSDLISWLNSSSAFCAGLTSVFSTRSLKASSSKTFRSSNIQTVGSSVIGNSTCPFSCIIIRSPHFSILDQRSEEHTSELQSRFDLVCRLLLEKKKINY